VRRSFESGGGVPDAGMQECNIQVIRNMDTRFLCEKGMLAMVHVGSTKE
jgi:hypothetical protein